MNLDFGTILIFVGFSTLVLALSQLYYGYHRFRFISSLEMGVASLLFSLRMFFYLFETRLHPSFVILPILAIGVEVLLIYRSIRSVAGYPAMTRSDLPVFFGFMILGFLSGFVFRYSMDQVVHSIYVLYFFSRAFVTVLRAMSEHRMRFGLMLFILVYIVANGLVRIYRGVFYLVTDVEFLTYSLDPKTLMTTLIVFLLYLMGNLGIFIVSVTRILDEVVEERDFATSLVSVISHDLYGYIGGIRQAAEIISDRSDPTIPVLAGNSAKALNLLTDLVYWGKSRNRNRATGDSPVILKPLIDGIIRDASPMIRGKNVSLELSGSIPSLMPVVDPVAASVVLRNLLSNAMKFSPADGRVSISFPADESLLLVKVSDTGPGMSRELLDAVGKGHTVKSARGSSGEKGMGIGLKIISTICQSNKWRLEFESHPGSGTDVTVGFPLYRPVSNLSP